MPRIDTYIYEGGVLTASLTDQGVAVGANTKRIIQSATLVNKTAGAVQCSVSFIDSGGVERPKISLRPLGINETYLCPELIGKGINQLGKVQALGLGVHFDYTAIEIV